MAWSDAARSVRHLNNGALTVAGDMYLDSFQPAAWASSRADFVLALAGTNLAYPDLLDHGVVRFELKAANPAAGQPVKITVRGELAHAQVGLPPLGGAGTGVLRAFGDAVPAVNLDARFVLGPDVTFVGYGIRAPLQPTDEALVVSGTPQRPRLEGRIQVVPGRASVPTGAINIQEFGVRYVVAPKLGDFTVPVQLQVGGEVWGKADKLVTGVAMAGRDTQPVHIYLQISGQLPDQVRIDTYSKPPLSEQQILAMLGIGTLGGLGPATGATSISEVVSKRFLSLLAMGFRTTIFEPIEEQLKRTLGLSELSINFTFDQPLELRIGKYMIKNFLVTYHTVMGEFRNEWEMGLSYELPRGLRVAFTTDDQNENLVQIEYTTNF